jgi:hypothetical protein
LQQTLSGKASASALIHFLREFTHGLLSNLDTFAAIQRSFCRIHCR